MLTKVGACSVRRCLRPQVVSNQLRNGHAPAVATKGHKDGHDDHHHHCDLSILERPMLESYDPLPETEYTTALAEFSEQKGYLEQKEYTHAADTSYLRQMILSPAVLKCIAEFNATEVHNPLKAKVLSQRYKEQYVNFQTATASLLRTQGVSQSIIDGLNAVYSQRAAAPVRQIKAAISQCRGVTFWSKGPARMSIGKENSWPMWKAFSPTYFSGSYLFNSNYMKSEKVFGEHNGKNAVEVNVRHLRGAFAFIKAVHRGLTLEEKQKASQILARTPFTYNLAPSEKHEIEERIKEVLDLLEKGNRVVVEKRVEEIWDKYRAGSHHRRYFARIFSDVIPTALTGGDLLTKYKEKHAVAFMVEGVDFWYDSEGRAATLKKCRDDFQRVVNDLHENAKATGNDEEKESANELKEQADTFLDPHTVTDVELLSQLLHGNFTERQEDEFFSVFRNDFLTEEDVSDQILLDVVGPSPVSQRLFGNLIEQLLVPKTDYTGEYFEGGDPIPNSADALKRFDAKLNEEKAPFLLVPDTKFPTSMEQLNHLRLLKLATEHYDIDIETPSGLAQFDHLIHSFDISPGEPTLDRCHPYVPDLHTYEEMPIIKFDAYEECDDDLPEAWGPELSTEEVKHKLNECLAARAKARGATPVTVDTLRASILTEEQVV
eukprot:TRINITY_DN1466_c0_g1_i5.p1 TRINITY_DN1466_c0_g1~~TRINITY_DN1466_c0_g1_i5.p1  ORF type:complete len:660 (-),score=147.40 TRINITY_DN1466_c0_g1_i5:442-2421(-)